MDSAKSVESSTSSAVSNSDLQLWHHRIRETQSNLLTPEVRERVMKAAQKQQRALKSVKRANYLQRTNYVSSAASATTLRTFSARPTPKEYSDVSANNAKWTTSMQSNIARDDEEAENELREVEEELRTQWRSMPPVERSGAIPQAAPNSGGGGILGNIFGFGARRDAAAPVSDILLFDGLSGAEEQMQAQDALANEVTTLLEQLAKEPTDEAELAAKFALFENFLNTVVLIRDQTLQFWEENKDQFASADNRALAAAQQEIRHIDNREAMGIVDNPHKWFVYSMTRKANDNSKAIGQTLAKLRSRLELLSREDLGDCPFCLDAMNVDASTVLGCCHRVCTDCWTHWSALKGNRAFCPLCKHEEFVQEILTTGDV